MERYIRKIKAIVVEGPGMQDHTVGYFNTVEEATATGVDISYFQEVNLTQAELDKYMEGEKNV